MQRLSQQGICMLQLRVQWDGLGWVLGGEGGGGILMTHFVSVFDAASRAIVILAPTLVPHVGAVFTPLICVFVCCSVGCVVLPPLLLPGVILQGPNKTS